MKKLTMSVLALSLFMTFSASAEKLCYSGYIGEVAIAVNDLFESEYVTIFLVPKDEPGVALAASKTLSPFFNSLYSVLIDAEERNKRVILSSDKGICPIFDMIVVADDDPE
ncbi:hypothetical protein [Hafnia alvei]|uniref:hypothetical protein n=1 Tax=Hafnia alvei TaxID=569 RepID=UPI000621206B|nr:hypothetical protein [Hafnia alvei]KKI45222.1 hypothetical protein XK86_09100 [Hafnia alvei]MDU7480806.1 hypothetical protein [Hafnia alvei]